MMEGLALRIAEALAFQLQGQPRLSALLLSQRIVPARSPMVSREQQSSDHVVALVYRRTFGSLATSIQNCSIVSTIWVSTSKLAGFVI